MHYNWDLDFKDGTIGEEQLRAIFADKKLEVKRDFLSHKTGNIAVEFESRGEPSGITTTQAHWWAFILDKEGSIILVPTEKLRTLIKGKKIVNGGDNDTSKMYLVSKKDLI